MPAAGYSAEMLSSGQVTLWRIDDWTQLGSYQIAGYQAGTWYTLTLRANGASLSVDVNGVTRINATDSTFTTGEVGVWSYNSGSADQHRFDNFAIQLLGGGGIGGRLYAPAYVPEHKPGLITRLLDLLRRAATTARASSPLAAPVTTALSAPPAGQV